MALAPSTRLGPYEVTAQIGAGGMGEVYLATDTNLKRQVAIKVLPEAVAADRDRLARFQREAEVLAALNHPNIAQIYGLEKTDAATALVMELVEGPTLADRIAGGAAPVPDALAIARQIAEALEAAHERGIVHRDLKPANVKVRADGTVKVLDFGLAKAVDPLDSSAATLAHSPTLTARATQAGMIVGTAAYMAPEQARGRAVDKRADIWALGVILYEMLTGQRAFAGDDISITLASVLKDDVAWSALPGTTPPALVRLLRRCLAKDPKARLRDAGDVRLEIEEILSSPVDVPTSAAPGRPSSAWIAGSAIAVLVIAALAAAVAWQLKPAGSSAPLRKFFVRAADGGAIAEATISPDGRALAFVSGNALWVRRLDTLQAQAIPGTSEVNSVFWSPDSTLVGFQSKTQLWKVAASGGTPAAICRVPREFSASGGATWLTDNRIVFTTGGSGLMEVSALGGEPRQILDPDLDVETDFHQVSSLPGGRGLMFVPHLVNEVRDRIDLFDGKSRRTIMKVSDGSRLGNPIYSPSGHLLYIEGGDLWAVPFSVDRLAATGERFRVAADGMQPTMADDGTLSIMNAGTSPDNMEAVWVGLKGEFIETVTHKGRPLQDPKLSPDGREIMGAVPGNGSADVWIVDLARRTERRLTYEPGLNTHARWSRDGKFVVYQCAAGICSRPADGSGRPVVLVPAPAARPELSPDDRTLLFVREQTVTSLDVFQVPLGPGGITAPPIGPPTPFIAAERMQYSAVPSPSGKYAVYSSNESGLSEIYVTDFPSGVGKWQIGPGQQPRWSAKGDRLYYVLGDSIAVVEVSTAPGLAYSEPKRVIAAPAGVLIPGYGFEVLPDGSRFLVNRSATLDTNPGVTIVQNWFAEFAGRAAR